MKKMLILIQAIGCFVVQGMSGHEFEAASLNSSAIPVPTRQGLIPLDAGCEAIASGLASGATAMEHGVRIERTHTEGMHSLRLYHDDDLLCVQDNEVLSSASRIVRLGLPGQESVYEYEDGRVTQLSRRDLTEANSSPITTTYGYNSSGIMEIVDGPRTDVNDWVQFEYDFHGNLVKRSNSLGHTHFFEYDDFGRLNSFADPNGLSAHLEYNETRSIGSVYSTRR